MAGRDTPDSSDAPTPPDLSAYLDGVTYPVSREDLVEHAERSGAPEDVRETLEALEQVEFESPAAVTKAVGELSR